MQHLGELSLNHDPHEVFFANSANIASQVLNHEPIRLGTGQALSHNSHYSQNWRTRRILRIVRIMRATSRAPAKIRTGQSRPKEPPC